MPADRKNIVNVESGSDVFAVPAKTDTGKLREQRRREAAIYIAKTMDKVYSNDELYKLCYDMGIDCESIPGDTKQLKIRALVGHFYRRRTLRVFVEFLEGDRPNEVWRIKQEIE